jgi:hypothetical protein
MKTDPELPTDVLQQIHANRKIEAIKLLREHRQLDLKVAKDIVDNYMKQNPQSITRTGSRSETGTGRFIYIIIVILLLYMAYQYSN